ncbi:MAG TPA: signal peptidase I [Ruminococcaceae bacterium]|nr:signal peptidase I [Oscillospiraceae bacterium]
MNGKKLHEVYIKEQKWSGNNVDLVVPKGDVFLMGDNRNNSSDSRIIGPVPNSDISGKVSVRLFPFSQFRTF